MYQNISQYTAGLHNFIRKLYFNKAKGKKRQAEKEGERISYVK